MKKILIFLLSILCWCYECRSQEGRIILGDEQTSEYFPILKGKRIAVFSNHTGMIGNKEAMPMLESMYQVL